EAVLSREDLDRVGKTAISRTTSWRLPADHPEAVPDERIDPDTGALHVLTSPEAVLVVVAGAGNSGVSAVVDTFGPRGDRPPRVPVAGWPVPRRPVRRPAARRAGAGRPAPRAARGRGHPAWSSPG